MNDLDAKKQRIETIAKIVGIAVTGFFVAPFIFLTIKGILGLAIAAGMSFVIVNFLPYFAMKVANWRLQAIKAEAMKNPIETLQNEYAAKQGALQVFKANIMTFAAQVLSFETQVNKYVREGLEDAAIYKEQLGKMKELLALRKKRYEVAVSLLAEFEATIQRTDRKWQMAIAAAKMNEAAGQIEGDAFSKICIETALEGVQTQLNQSLAELETALLDDKVKAEQHRAFSTGVESTSDEKSNKNRQKIQA